MSVAQQAPDFQTNLDQLHAESLTHVVLFAGMIDFAWLCWLIWPVTGKSAPASAWLGVGLLTLSVIISYELKERYLRLATHLLVWGISGAIFCAVLALQAPAMVYLFVLSIVFASTLMTQRGVFLVAIVSGLLTLTIGLIDMESVSLLLDVILPIVVIAMVTIASWLSARNLYVALAWVWSGYEQARHNEQIVRERQAELRRVLKALDEANYRTARINYMLRLARDQAEEARRLKQQFVQTISHELRTPLNLIVGFTELMTQSPEHYGSQLSPAYLRDLTIVHRNASHLQGLVNDVLDLARIEAAQMSLLPQETDPVELVRDAIKTVRSLVETRGLNLNTKLESGLPALMVDPIRIRQVLFNLLNNAVRFTERGDVTVSACRQGEEITFSVADTGIGMTPEDISHIFEEFHQLDGSTRRPHGGAGLGLAICQRFIEMHGGRIWVESQVGQGSTFYFSLPINQTDLAAVPENVPAEVTTQAMAAHWGKRRVMLAITRSPSAAALLTRYVRGCRTVILQDLEQARQTAQQLMPQAVVIDRACESLIPEELEALARTWELPHTPFIICPLPGEESQRQELTADGYLVKPVTRRSLWDVLRPFGEDVDRILVIDDDRDFVRLMGRLLDSPIRRYQVVPAYSGHEGLSMMRYREPDLVLLDLGLPDMDGFQVIEHIRGTPRWRHIPIVVVSGQDETDNMAALTGAMSISKPEGIMPGEIVQWLQKVLDTTTEAWHAPDGRDEYQLSPSG